jgi:hypothetical protein
MTYSRLLTAAALFAGGAMATPAQALTCENGVIVEYEYSGHCNWIGDSDDGVPADTPPTSTPPEPEVGYVAFQTPPNGSYYLTGSTVAPTARAGIGQKALGNLSLTITIDTSRSMDAPVANTGKTRYEIAVDAVNALLDDLPETASVGVVEFNSFAEYVSLSKKLTPEHKADLQSRLPTIQPDDQTNYERAIQLSYYNVQTSPYWWGQPEASANQQVLFISDGQPTEGGNWQYGFAPGGLRSNDVSVNTVGIGQLNYAARSTLNHMADVFDGKFIDIGSNITGLLPFFQGLNGNLVGVDHVMVTDPNGTYRIDNVGLFGEFTLRDTVLGESGNLFEVTAYFDDGTFATDQMWLAGVGPATAVPLPATGLMLIASIAGFGLMRRKRG